MAKKPYTIPRFATDADPGQIVEPVELTRQGGLEPGDKPPAQWLNWLFHHNGAWIDFLRGQSYANWKTVYPTYSSSGVTLTMGDVDATTEETWGTDTLVRRIVATCDVANSVMCSPNGDDWKRLAVTAASGTNGTILSICFTGSQWLLGLTGGTNRIIATPPDPQVGSAIADDSATWTPLTTPAIASIAGFSVGGGFVVAWPLVGMPCQSTTAGTTFTAISTSAGLTGDVKSIVWTGTHFLGVTDDGELIRTTDPSTTWTRTTPFTAASWKLATDGDGTVIAYVDDVTWYVSDDHGATWSTQDAPLFPPVHIAYVDGVWIGASNKSPFLLSANDTPDSYWQALPFPASFVSGLTPNHSFVLGIPGTTLVFGSDTVLVAHRAEDLALGPWAPSDAPDILWDAAYLRGRLIHDAAPTDGAVLEWSDADQRWQPGTGSGGSATSGDWKNSVRAATTASITLSGTQTIDGVACIAGNRVLVKNQGTASQNGIYVVAAGAWSRSADALADADVTSGLTVFVSEGTTNGGKNFQLTTADPITVGATSLTFAALAAGLTNPLTADLSAAGSYQITNLQAPVASSNEAARIVDVEAVAWKLRCRLATAAALPALTATAQTLTANANGALTVDGTAVVAGDRVLVKNQSSAAQNGIYVVTATGDGSNPFVLTRADDANTATKLPQGTIVVVLTGTANTGYEFTLAATITTIGTDAQTWINWSVFHKRHSVFSLGKITTTAEAGSPLAIWRGSIRVSDFPQHSTYRLRINLSCSAGTAYLRMYNLTDSVDVVISTAVGGDSDDETLDTTNTSAAGSGLDSINLYGTTGFDTANDDTYEVRLYVNDSANMAILGSAELIVSY